MGNKVAIDGLYAERISLRSLLTDMPSDDILGRMGLEAKLKDIDALIKKLGDVPETVAETILYLGTTNGSQGIDVSLASDILKSYQVYISAIHAAKTQENPLSESGPIPSVETSAMQLVGTPRGSFGFALKEKTDQARLTKSELHESVEVANELIAVSAFKSEADFEEAISEEPARVIKELNNFLKTLEKYNTSIKLVSTRTQVDIPKEKIGSASSRTENIEITEKDEHKEGIFLGARKHSRDFNFQPDNEEPISGKLGKEVEDHTVSLMNMEFQDKRCKAVLVRKETRRKESGRTSIRWTLKDIHLSEGPSQKA